jgi:hypothetical protein
MEGFRAASAKSTQLTKMEADRNRIESTVNRYRDAWESFKSWIVNAGVWAGSGAGWGAAPLAGGSYVAPGLGIAPLIPIIAIPAMLGAIAWVVYTYFRLRADLDYDSKLLTEVGAGRLTPAQDQAMGRSGGAGLSLAGGLGLLAGAILALVVLRK